MLFNPIFKSIIKISWVRAKIPSKPRTHLKYPQTIKIDPRALFESLAPMNGMKIWLFASLWLFVRNCVSDYLLEIVFHVGVFSGRWFPKADILSIEDNSPLTLLS